MKNNYQLTKADSDLWHSIKNNIHDDDAILNFISDKAKKSGKIILVGVNTVAPIHFGGKADWQFVFLASKPRSGYLNCLGNYYKVYPNGKIMQKIGRNFVTRGGKK